MNIQMLTSILGPHLVHILDITVLIRDDGNVCGHAPTEQVDDQCVRNQTGYFVFQCLMKPGIIFFMNTEAKVKLQGISM